VFIVIAGQSDRRKPRKRRVRASACYPTAKTSRSDGLVATGIGAPMSKRRIEVRDLTQMSDDDVIDRAVRAYLRHARRSATPPHQPSLPCCAVSNGEVVVANAYRTLAVYKIGKFRLTRLPPSISETDAEYIAWKKNVVLRYDELLTALESAGFALAKCNEPYLRAIPFTGCKDATSVKRMDKTADSILDHHDLVRRHVIRGEGTVPMIIAHFTRRWADSQLPFDGEDAA